MFVYLFHVFRDRKLLLGMILLVLFVISGFFLFRLSFEEDITRIMPKDKQLDQVGDVYRKFDFIDKLVITVSLRDSTGEADPDRLIEYADKLADSVKQTLYPDYTTEVLVSAGEEQVLKIYDFIHKQLPLFLDEEDYPVIDSLIQKESIDRSVRSNYRTLISPASSLFKKYIVLDPLNFVPMALARLDEFRVAENFVMHKDHFFSSNLRHLFIFLTPANPSSESKMNNHLIQILGKQIDLLEDEMGDVTAEYYGGVAVAVGNANRIKRDIAVTISIAVLLILLMIGLFFRRFVLFFVIFLPAIFGAILSLAILSFVSHGVSAISLAIGSVLIGITIDYGLHFFTHYKHVGSVDKVIDDIASPVVMSSITTGSAFLCLLLIESDVLKDLGLFAAFSVFIASLFSLLVLPHFVKEGSESNPKLRVGLVQKIAAFPLDKNRYIILGVFIVSFLSLFFFRKVGFEGNMYAMNYMSDELTEAEANLSQLTDLTMNSTYIITRGEDFNEALRKNEKLLPELDMLKEEHVISNYLSVSSFFVSDSIQRERIKRWEQYWSIEKREKFLSDLISAGSQFHFKESAFDGVKSMIDREYRTISGRELLQMDLAIFKDWISESDDEVYIANQVKIDREQRQLIYSRFGDEGVIIFDKSFITDKLIEVLKSNFKFLLIVSLSLVFAFLLLYFGRIELAAISFIPILLSWLWTLGIMGIMGIKFTIFNIIISTFVFGLGIDYSLFMMRGLLQEFKLGYQNFNSYKTSILLSATTTIIGIGVLLFAKHPALKSIAAVSVVGITSVIIISFTVQPILFRWLLSRRSAEKFIPVTCVEAVVSLYRMLILFLFHVFFLLPAFPIYLIPVSRNYRYRFLLNLIHLCSKGILLFVGFSRRRNICSSDFPEGPGIYLCAEDPVWSQLVLQTMSRMVVLYEPENRQRKNRFSLFFGIPERFFNHFFSEENSGEKDKHAVSILYAGIRTVNSVTPFPRVDATVIHLARITGMDIIPVILYRATAVFDGRGSFLVPDKIRITHIGPIPFPEEKTSVSLSGEIREINEQIENQCAQFMNQVRIPDTLRRVLMRNYIFKGPVLEWYLKIKIRLEKNYTLFHELLPAEGVITDIGCGYGSMTYMLSLLSPNRQLAGIDYDEEKIRVANHCPIKNDKITFSHGDISKMDLPISSAFILSDVLHYMPFDMQEKLIKRCAEKLAPDGRIIIREGDAGMKSRHLLTRLSEFFSTRLAFNKTLDGKKNLFFPSRAKLTTMLSKQALEVEVIDTTRYTSNLIYIAKRTTT